MNLAIVLADFHKEISGEMLAHAEKTAQENGISVVAVSRVTGAFDVPLPLKRLLARPDVDAAIVLGAVVEGETSHDEVVAYTCAEKVAELSLQFDKPVGYGISGPRMSVAQAKARAKEFSQRAVETVKRMLSE